VADGWERSFEGPNLVALSKDGASITLEPGGQMELSGAPLRTIREICQEFTAHVELVKQLSEDLGIVWLGLGGDPFHDLSAIPQVPKIRYDLMRAYLPTRGDLALDMMHATATVQANFDYASEADMVAKLRMAMACSPVVSALYANSCISLGKENGFATRRVEIWRHTDPDRCGVLHFVFDEDFGYRRYAEWALDVPLFFVVRGGQYVAAAGQTFREFLERGFELPSEIARSNGGETRARATLADWELHLTTLFPEVRLKRFIEVRGADAVPQGLICALPALWKGLLYDDQSLAAAGEVLGDLSPDQRDEALVAVSREGMAARVGGQPVSELAALLCQLAADGLRRIHESGESEVDERSFLEPLQEILERGQSPAEDLLERWRGDWHGSPERLVEYARY
jgi:glutamate--cysteine ligase